MINLQIGQSLLTAETAALKDLGYSLHLRPESETVYHYWNLRGR